MLFGSSSYSTVFPLVPLPHGLAESSMVLFVVAELWELCMECSVLSLLPQLSCSDPSKKDVVASGSEGDPLPCGDVLELSLPPHP